MGNLSLKDEFRENGYVVIPQLFSSSEVDGWREDIISLSSLTPESLSDGDKSKQVMKWTKPSGPSIFPNFHDVIVHEGLLSKLREIFGEELKYLHHNDLHAGYGAHGWHRDNVFRGKSSSDRMGPDFDESSETYSVARVAIYLQTFEESGFKFGLVPQSHRKSPILLRLESSRIIDSIKNRLKIQDYFFTKTHWVKTTPGDVVIFDTRLLHRGGYTNGPKYSFYLGYGVQNSHFNRHWTYFSEFREDLNYQPPSG